MAGDLRVVVSRDGALACLVETRQVAVFQLPALERDAEVGIEDGAEVALVGETPRLVVLAPSGTLHIVDPRGKDGPEKIGELDVDAGSKIVATSGDHVLISSAHGAAFALIGEQPGLARVPARGALGAAGASAFADHFLIVVGGVLEEWSATARSPQRRFRLDKPVAARHVGAGQRHIWFVPETQPDHIVVVARTGAARPAQIALPEPVERIAADPNGVQLAIIGATTGAIFAVPLGERTVTKLHAGPADDVAWRGPHAFLYVREGALAVVELRTGNGQPEPRPAAAPAEPRTPEPKAEATPMSAIERLSAWKAKMAARAPEAPQPDAEPEPLDWRDAIVRWTKRQLTGGKHEPPLLAAGPLHDVGMRLGFTDDDRLALWLAYGARLLGLDGLAPADLVEVCPRRWADALGTSALGESGAFRWRRERVHLTPVIRAAIDERPPLYGTIATAAIQVAQTVAVVAPTGTELDALGGWAAPSLGALLVPNARGLAQPQRLVLEARARGLAPLVPWSAVPELPSEPSVIVVEDHAIAERLGVPLALTWGA